MWIDMSSILSLFLRKRFYSPFVSHLPHASPLRIARLAAHHFGPNTDSYQETWVRKPPGAFFWRSHGLQERGRAWTLVLFFLPALARIERAEERKGWRGLECGSGSGGRNVSSLFVSVCGAWWMSWVDVMTWLIAQTLNKSPILQQASPSGTPLCHCCQPTWADIVAGRAGGSAAPLSGE